MRGFLLLNEARAQDMASERISDVVPDWDREKVAPGEWNPGKFLLRSIRDFQVYKERSGLIALIRRKLAVLRHRVWTIATGADIPLTCRIGGGLLIPHPNGIVIHPAAEIGPNCLLFQQVTIGVINGPPPKLLGHVDVGAEAKLLGAIAVGAGAKIGANAVVLIDVPSNATAAGCPA